jgi:hypothetical protein
MADVSRDVTSHGSTVSVCGIATRQPTGSITSTYLSSSDIPPYFQRLLRGLCRGDLWRSTFERCWLRSARIPREHGQQNIKHVGRQSHHLPEGHAAAIPCGGSKLSQEHELNLNVQALPSRFVWLFLY